MHKHRLSLSLGLDSRVVTTAVTAAGVGTTKTEEQRV